MAVTTLDGAIAGLIPSIDATKIGITMKAAGALHSHWYSTGNPAASALPTGGLNGVVLTAIAGQLPWTDPTSGNSYLARMEVEASQPGTLWLVDRLWHNVLAVTNGAQAITTPTWPARDRNGSTNGVDVQIGLETTGGTPAPAGSGTLPVITYVDSGGTGGNTGTVLNMTISPVVGQFMVFGLAAGDSGVRSISSCNLQQTWTGGTVSLVAYRVLGKIGIPLAGQTYMADGLSLGFPRIYDDSVLFFLWIPSSTTAVTFNARILVAQG